MSNKSREYQELIKIKESLNKMIEIYSNNANLFHFKYEAEINKKRKLNTLINYLYSTTLDKDLKNYFGVRFLREIPGFNTLKGAKQVVKIYLAPLKEEDIKKRDKITIPNLKKRLSLIDKMQEIIDTLNLKVSKSPYSSSFYAHKNNEKISWGYKPQNSYRLSDHWNFLSDGEMHCITDMTIKDNEECLAIYKNGKYSKVA